MSPTFLRVWKAPRFFMVLRPFAETVRVTFLTSSGRKMVFFWRFTWRRRLPVARLPAGRVAVLTLREAALAVLPESSGLLPAWVVAPDATAAGKLTTLAQELGFLLLPETLMVDDFRTIRVERADAALQQAEPVADAQVVPITITAEDGRRGTMSLVVSFLNGAQMFQAAAAEFADHSVSVPF